jgi:hypothetical protein
VKVAPVVEPGERVEVGEPARLAEPSRVLDRRAGPLRQLLELADRLLLEAVTRRAAVDGDEAERSRLAGNRNRQAGVNELVDPRVSAGTGRPS